MIHTSELGSALRYRYKSLVSVFLLITCASWWLFASHAARGGAHGPAAAAMQPEQTQQPAGPAPPTPDVSTLTSPGLSASPAVPDVRRDRSVSAARNPALIKQRQTSLWAAIERRNAIEARLAELAAPAAPIVRQAPSIASVSPELRAATARVAAAKTNLTELQTRYTDAYPDVVQAKDELTEAEQAMYAARHLASSAPAKAHLVAPSPPSAQVEAERTTLRGELTDLAATIPDLKAQLEAASALPRRVPVGAAARSEGYWPLVLPQAATQPSPSVAPSLAPPATSVAASETTQAAPLQLLSAHSLLFLPQSMLLGFLASAILLAVLESLDGTIKGPESLRKALPAEARQLSLRSMRA